MPNRQPHLVTPGAAKTCKQRGFPFVGGLAFATHPFADAVSSPRSCGLATSAPGCGIKGGGGSKSAPGRQPATTWEEPAPCRPIQKHNATYRNGVVLHFAGPNAPRPFGTQSTSSFDLPKWEAGGGTHAT